MRVDEEKKKLYEWIVENKLWESQDELRRLWDFRNHFKLHGRIENFWSLIESQKWDLSFLDAPFKDFYDKGVGRGTRFQNVDWELVDCERDGLTCEVDVQHVHLIINHQLPHILGKGFLRVELKDTHAGDIRTGQWRHHQGLIDTGFYTVVVIWGDAEKSESKEAKVWYPNAKWYTDRKKCNNIDIQNKILRPWIKRQIVARQFWVAREAAESKAERKRNAKSS